MNKKQDKIVLYHLTSSEKLPQILKEGLVPHNGDHCKKIGDSSSDIVFLCMEQDIRFWMRCFRDVDILITIDCTSMRPSLRKRSQNNAPTRYEYGCITEIDPKYFSSISRIKLQAEKETI